MSIFRAADASYPPALKRILTLFLTLCILPCARVSAHPHVWINYGVELEMHGTQVDAVQEKWVFEQGFPVSLVIDLTHIPKAGPLADADVAAFKEQAFTSLKNADYFTHLFVAGQALQFDEPQHFAVAVENDKIVYTFLLPLHKPVDAARTTLEVGIWDDSFFVDYEPINKPAVRFSSTAAASCKSEPFQDHDHAIFGGAMFPFASRISC